MIRHAFLTAALALFAVGCTPVSENPPALTPSDEDKLNEEVFCAGIPKPPEGAEVNEMNSAQETCKDVPPLPPNPPGVHCNADRVTRWLSMSMGNISRSEETEKHIKLLSGARTLRWISPGMAVTMDYRTDRLNLDLDAQGRIARAHCG